MISLEVKDLAKSFGYRKVFEGVYFSIKKWEIPGDCREERFW